MLPMINKLRRPAVLALCAFLLAGCLFGCSKVGEEETAADETFRYADGTELYGVDVSGLTEDEAMAALNPLIEEYEIGVTLDDTAFTMTGAQLGLEIDPDADWQAAAEDSSIALFKTMDADKVQSAMLDSYTAAAMQQAAEADAEAAQAAAEAGEENDGEEMTSPEELEAAEAAGETGEETAVPRDVTKASIRYDEEAGKFVGVDGEEGTALGYDGAAEDLIQAACLMEKTADLHSEQEPAEGEKAAESADCRAALEEANSYLKLQLTYTFTPKGSETKSHTITSDDIAGWLMVQNDGLSVELDTSAIGSYVSDLADTYSVAGANTSKFKTSSGSYITVNVAAAGQTVDTEALYNDLMDCLANKTSGTREAPYSTTSEDAEYATFGGNYIEIDLTNQKVYCYKNGSLLVSSSCVTGCVWEGHATPTGVYSIFAMDSDTYLEGPGYKSYVNYFMPFNGGIGLHDASWRSSFGGSIYLYNGSHGCINMPYSAVKTIYDNVYCGYKVVVYGGVTSVDKLNQSWTGTTSYSVTEGSGSFNLNVAPSDEDSTVTYSSSNTSVVTVSSTGKVTVVGPGSATITAKASETSKYYSSTCKISVTVNKKEVSQTVSADNLSLTVGETGNVNASAKTSLTYDSDNPGVATVNSNGTVTAVSAGTANITIKAAAGNGYSAASKTVTVTVTAAPKQDQSITISVGSSTLAVGETTQASVSGAQTGVTYTSSNEAVATVSSDGTVTAVGPGSAVITARAEESSSYNSATHGVQITVTSAEEPAE